MSDDKDPPAYGTPAFMQTGEWATIMRAAVGEVWFRYQRMLTADDFPYISEAEAIAAQIVEECAAALPEHAKADLISAIAQAIEERAKYVEEEFRDTYMGYGAED